MGGDHLTKAKKKIGAGSLLGVSMAAQTAADLGIQQSGSGGLDIEHAEPPPGAGLMQDTEALANIEIKGTSLASIQVIDPQLHGAKGSGIKYFPTLGPPLDKVLSGDIGSEAAPLKTGTVLDDKAVATTFGAGPKTGPTSGMGLAAAQVHAAKAETKEVNIPEVISEEEKMNEKEKKNSGELPQVWSQKEIDDDKARANVLLQESFSRITRAVCSLGAMEKRLKAHKKRLEKGEKYQPL